MGWWGIGIGSCLGLGNMLGRGSVGFKIKVKGGGRLGLINLKVLLWKLGYWVMVVRW